jgi:uncharacterized protein HemX
VDIQYGGGIMTVEITQPIYKEPEIKKEPIPETKPEIKIEEIKEPETKSETAPKHRGRPKKSVENKTVSKKPTIKPEPIKMNTNTDMKTVGIIIALVIIGIVAYIFIKKFKKVEL